MTVILGMSIPGEQTKPKMTVWKCNVALILKIALLTGNVLMAQGLA